MLHRDVVSAGPYAMVAAVISVGVDLFARDVVGPGVRHQCTLDRVANRVNLFVILGGGLAEQFRDPRVENLREPVH